MLRLGHSNDRRPDGVQFNQGLGTVAPAGVPLLTATRPGNQADDPLSVPAWRERVQTIGHSRFWFVGDCKAAPLATRAQLDQKGGFYLFPLPLTGEVPETLCQWVTNPPVKPEPLRLADVTDEQGEPYTVAQGFIVACEMEAQ